MVEHLEKDVHLKESETSNTQQANYRQATMIKQLRNDLANSNERLENLKMQLELDQAANAKSVTQDDKQKLRKQTEDLQKQLLLRTD